MEITEQKALTAVRTLLWAARDVLSNLFTERGLGSRFQDQELRDMYFQLNHMSVQISRKLGEEEE